MKTIFVRFESMTPHMRNIFSKALLIMPVLALFIAAAVSPVPANAEEQASPNALIRAGELFELISEVFEGSDANIVVLDLRPDDMFLSGHVPGALNVQHADYRNKDGLRPDERQWKSLMENLGIRPEDSIFLYDDSEGLDSARFWWLLRLYGHKGRVALLDGMFDSWKIGGHPFSTEKNRKRKPSRYSTTFVPSLLSESEDVLRAVEGGGTAILDVRSAGEYSGEEIARGTAKGGRIRNSKNLEWNRVLDENGYFLPEERLVELFGDVSVVPGRPVLAYCRSGKRAAHTIFVLREILGRKEATLYDPGWIEWSANDSLPSETD